MQSKRLFMVFLMCGVIVLAGYLPAAGEIPHLINYQGKLTDDEGSPITDTVDLLTFKIFNASSGGDKRWEESHADVAVNDGIFSVILGSQSGGINLDFSEEYWLEVMVGAETVTPRRQLTSIGYSYRSLVADSAIVAGSSGEVDCHDCDTVFVNAVGPDSVVATLGTAFLGRTSGSSTSGLFGIRGRAENASSGHSYGGFFSTSSTGTGRQYAVRGEALGTSVDATYGVFGYADNNSSGKAYGGYFSTSTSGAGRHYGVNAIAEGASSEDVFGVRGIARNTSTAEVYGGDFDAGGAGTGERYGVIIHSWGYSSERTYGCYGYGFNNSSGTVYAGYFWADVAGTGTHYGVYGDEAAGGSGAAVYAAGDFGGSGGKYAVMKTSKGHRLLSVIESPEVWFEDFGEGRLENGKARIELDPLFLETVTINAQHPMKVFLQLTSGEPMNVVIRKGFTGFDALAEDPASMATFDWRIVAKRKGYETQRLRETDIGYDDPNLYPELKAKMEKEREKEGTE